MDKLLSETLAGKHYGSFVMVDSLEISFIDADNFRKWGKSFFLRERSKCRSLRNMQTFVSWLKLIINLAKSTYPNQRPDSPSQAFSFCFIQICYELNLWTQNVCRNKGADRSKVRLYSITCKLKEVYSNREAKCLRESLREFIL